MENPSSRSPWLLAYFAFCLVNIFAESQSLTWLIFTTKPALMVLLCLWFYGQTKANFTPFAKWILAGLFCSIFGDTFLMFVENAAGGELFFLLGLGSFLLTHLCYFIAFLRYSSDNQGLIQQRKWLLLPFVLFFLGNTYLLWPGVPADMKIPVVIYSIVIVLMAIGALHLRTKMAAKAWQILFAGVLLFVVSDTIIGVNKFVQPVPFARVLIMFFYLMGQYLIAAGSRRANLMRLISTY